MWTLVYHYLRVARSLASRSASRLPAPSLSGIHPHALQAAEAAEAAGAQGRFWEMHDLLFANQNKLRPKDLIGYGEKLSLDMERYSAELKNHRHEDRVRLDFRRGVANGVFGTPGLFINGIRYNGPLDPESLISYLKGQC